MSSLGNRIANLFARGVIRLINNTKKMQEIQASFLADEEHDGLERFQNYGFSSYPLPGAECIAAFMAGRREHGIVLAVEDRDLRKSAQDNVTTVTTQALQPGDVMIYTGNDNFIILRASTGNLVIHSPGTIRLDANQIEIHALTKIKWDCGGRGFDYYPTKTDTWETGSVAGSTNPITPPEHPPTPAT